MTGLIVYIQNISEQLALRYHLDVGVFLTIYILSFIPFYLGYLLMIYGTTRDLRWSDIICFKLTKRLHWNRDAKLGLYTHLFGRVMPYVYIVLFTKNLPIWLYVIVYGVILISVFVLFKKIRTYQKHNPPVLGALIVKKEVIEDHKEVQHMWRIYDTTFSPLNKESPCKQSLDESQFVHEMADKSVIKYILYSKSQVLIGFALITNDFKNTPWISEDYFSSHFPETHQKKQIYYFVGLAVDKAFRGNRYSLYLMEHIFDDIPETAIFGFDHSHNINSMLHHFTRIIRQSGLIKRLHIDRQHYHVVQRK